MIRFYPKARVSRQPIAVGIGESAAFSSADSPASSATRPAEASAKAGLRRLSAPSVPISGFQFVRYAPGPRFTTHDPRSTALVFPLPQSLSPDVPKSRFSPTPLSSGPTPYGPTPPLPLPLHFQLFCPLSPAVPTSRSPRFYPTPPMLTHPPPHAQCVKL